MDRRSGRERGATLVLVALMLTALMVIAALVIDLSVVRQNRQTDKSAADFAAAAGIRNLDDGSSSVQPWRGICAAREYLLANDDEFSGMTSTYTDGDGAPVAGDPCASPPATTCNDGDPSTWGTLTGLVDGGRIRVTISNGYVMPDPAFPEDADSYPGDDTGDGPCDNLAVIIEESEDTYFGGAAGSSGYESTIRSVARLVQGTTGDVTASLLLLEREDCLVLEISGTSGARVHVAGHGSDPGVVHADSLGNGSDCDAGNVENGNIYQVNGNPPDPRIVAERSADGSTPGQITTTALSGAPGAEPAVASSPSPDEVCVQVDASDCGPSPTTGGSLEGRPVVGRGRVDARYRQPIIDLHDLAAARFAGPPAGWTVVGCDDPGPFAASQIWVDCGGGEFSGNGKVFADTVDDVVIDGHVVVDGNGNALHFVDIRTLFVAGQAEGNGIELKGTDNQILINDGTLLDLDGDSFVCDDRTETSPAARTKLVVGQGGILGEGGSGKVLRMCSTTVFMMDNSSGDCPVPTSDGEAPYENGCGGGIRVAGDNQLEWTAPNVNTDTAPTPDQLDQFEDLAFWSESQNTFEIEGNGGVLLFGIFFTPNGDPFRVGGQGTYDIEDAQFISRKLEVAGNGTLVLQPLPQNSIQIPVLGGFTLVR